MFTGFPAFTRLEKVFKDTSSNKSDVKSLIWFKQNQNVGQQLRDVKKESPPIKKYKGHQPMMLRR